MGQKSRWTLPRVVNPPNFRRFEICVPDEPFYIAAFQGLLIELTYSKNWQRDPDHTAAIVSRVWQEALANLTCHEPCGIVESDYEMSICEQLRIHQGKLQGYCCGEWVDIPTDGSTLSGGAAQDAPGGTVPLGECRSYSAVLQGSGLWHLPVSVQGGDTITVSLAQGGWHDGSVSPWYCPNGQSYALGACVGSGGTSGTDPAPSIDHMRLIANYNSVYVDAYNVMITIPDGTPATDLIFQANDSDLTDNSGSISFNVEYCRAGTATWCAKFNAANGWGDIVGSSGGGAGCTPTLVSGVWHSCTGTDGNQKLRIELSADLPSGSRITHIADTGTTTDADPLGRAIQITVGAQTSYSQQPGGSGTFNDYLDGSFGGPFVIQWAANANGGGAATTMSEVVISGTGDAPDWADGFDC